MMRSFVARRASALPLLSVLAVFLALSPTAYTQRQPGRQATVVEGREAVPGEVLVRFDRLVPLTERLQLERQVDAEVSEPLLAGIRRLRSRSFDVDTLLAFLRAHPRVELAEPNYVWSVAAVPNDPKFSSLWGLLNTGQTIQGRLGVPGADIGAAAAWDITRGDRATVVGVIDTGIDYTHPDLSANVWRAPAAFTVTVGGVSVTCAAGTYGFNAITNSCDPMDDHNHGTHVAGTIGATGNNGIGVTGVTWTSSLMGLKFLDAAGKGSTANAIKAIEFAMRAKQAFSATGGADVRVLSNSWGGSGFSQALLDAINSADASGMLFVAAAGNSGTNNDQSPHYPASYTAPNVVAVAATDNSDLLASFSNYGAASVDVAAPGKDILSTTVGGGYQYFSGTSMATPHVSGAAALILAKCALDTAALKTSILSHVSALPSLAGLIGTGGRLNVASALLACAPPSESELPAPPTGLTATPGPAIKQITLRWTASAGATSYTVKRSRYDGGPYKTIASGVTGTEYVNTGLRRGRQFYYVVVAVNAAGQSGPSNQATAVVP
jgi:serine protease